MLTFTCTVIGGGITVWNGTAFSCSGSTNDIQLRHTQFNATGGPSKSCNDDAIEARSIGVTNDCYASQLIMRVSPRLNNTTIQCTHDSNIMGPREIGTSTLNFLYRKYIVNDKILFLFHAHSYGQNSLTLRYYITLWAPNKVQWLTILCRSGPCYYNSIRVTIASALLYCLKYRFIHDLD